MSAAREGSARPMIRAVQHGSGFSAIVSEPGCPTAKARTTFVLYDATGPVKDTEFVGVPAGRKIALQGPGAAAVARVTGNEGLKLYCRVADRTPIDRQPDLALLDRLAMHLKVRDDLPGQTPRHSGIPAAYTYLGQFIAHELSKIAVLGPAGSPAVRTSALDLDSLFGAVPDDPLPTQAQIWKGGVGIGQARAFRPTIDYDDLPRRADGVALIAEPRNDSNLALAQLHLALSKFHQFVAQNAGDRTGEAARRITRRHVHSVVLHDFLRRVIAPCVYEDVRRNGRRIVYPGALAGEAPILVPIEFAAACFRVGHSMVRESYERWVYAHPLRPAGLDSLLRFTGQSEDGFGNLHHLSTEWRINWASMLGDGPDPSGQINMASGLDKLLAPSMHTLEPRLFSASLPASAGAERISVARATLVRQRLHEMSSGQETVAVLNRALPEPRKIPVLDASEVVAALADGDPDPVALTKFLTDHGFDRQTPLWLYCLLESRLLGAGLHFGPLTSRVVMETIHAAIDAAPDSIIAGDGRSIAFESSESLSGDAEFRLPDLVAIASSWPEGAAIQERK